MMRLKSLCLAILVLVCCAACDDDGAAPTRSITAAPLPTVIPPTAVGPLNSVTIDKFNLSMLVPSNWKAPVLVNDNSVVLSPDGSTDTSPAAGPFLLVIIDNTNYFHSRLSVPLGISDPVAQLQAMMTALNLSEPEMGSVTAYKDAKYPAATIQYYARDNVSTISLLKTGQDQWIYVGTQAKERYSTYYEATVFKPVLDSITLKP